MCEVVMCKVVMCEVVMCEATKERKDFKAVKTRIKIFLRIIFRQ